MAQTILMGLAAINLVAVACFITAARFGHILLYQFFPVLLALGLSVFATGRYMGWPI